MALNKNIELGNGIKVEGAYLRVENISITKEDISFSLCKYVKNNTQYFDKAVYVSLYDINGENPFKQAYLYLKTLPEYADAIDC